MVTTTIDLRKLQYLPCTWLLSGPGVSQVPACSLDSGISQIPGWYLPDPWLVSPRSLVGSSKIPGWYLPDPWLVSPRSLVGISKIPGWYLPDPWLVSPRFLVIRWTLVISRSLVAPWNLVSPQVPGCSPGPVTVLPGLR